MNKEKTVNNLLNEMVEAQVITEAHKILLLNWIEKEKIDYAQKVLNELKTKILSNEEN